MNDIVLVTADSIRRDYTDEFDFLGSLPVGTGVTASHYTRTSLASLLCSRYESALTGEVSSPTLPERLSDAGYTCLGFSPNPNTDPRFGFGRGFDTYDSFVEPGKRGSVFREHLSKFDILRRLYYKLYPPQVKMEDRPTDREVVEMAIERFNERHSPRFLWVHLMESHRPYGRDEGITRDLDQKAYFDSAGLSSEERETIDRAYRGAIRRVDGNVQYLLENLDADDPLFVFTSDHGEPFGETGFYFHKSHKRSVHDVLTNVPVIVQNVPLETPVSLLDIPATLLDACDLIVPDRWDGCSRVSSPAKSAVTIAPWAGKATLAWQNLTKEQKIVARDTDVTIESTESVVTAERPDVDADLEERLRDLGYQGPG